MFEGLTNSADVKAWLNIVKKYFEVMSCLEEQQVRFASFLL